MFQVVSSMDAMKYASMEADKYRAAYIPPSNLAMSMYPDAKYLESSSKSYLDRSYLDSAKAYFEQSKLYMDQKPDFSRHPSANSVGGYDQPNKLYDQPESSPGGANSLSRSPVTDSPDGMLQGPPGSNKSQNSHTPSHNEAQRAQDLVSSSGSSASTSSPGATLPPYYQTSAQGPAGLLASSQMAAQYSSYQNAATGPGNEFRRPLTVIFWPDRA